MAEARDRKQRRHRVHLRIRKRLAGTAQRPRLVIFRSLNNVYAQVVDDVSGKTLVAASDLDPALREELKAAKLKKTQVAQKVGALVAKKCLEAKLEQVVFDRNGFPYHGRIAAAADAAREAGLQF